MSNYLFVAGNREQVEKIKAHFLEKHNAEKNEINFQVVSEGRAILVIERRNSETESSIFLHDSGHGLFFRGQALDHETSSMILGGSGFFDYQKRFPRYRNPSEITDFEGSYVLARWNDDEFSIQTDLYSIYRLLFYSNERIIVASDSLVLITDCMRKLGVERILNYDVARIKAWNASGLPNCPFTPELIMKGVFTSQVGSSIRGSWKNGILKSELFQRNVPELFISHEEEYAEALANCLRKMYSSINFAVEAFSPVIEFGLSGGVDSRLLLALCLQSQSIMDKLIINTNKSDTRIDDYNVVSQLSKLYSFEFNNNVLRREKLSQFTQNREMIINGLGFWKLASLGTYDAFYMTSHFYFHPCILHMSGVGAEPVKQLMDTSRIDKLANSQHPLVREMVRQKLAETVSNMGISPDSEYAMKFFHMSYKASYHLGFKIAQSSMLMRPYVQKSIFSIGISENNPFRGKPNQGPTVLHDMMILLDPELASLPYDTEKKNISQEYAYQRLVELGGPIEFDDLSNPLIFGSIEDVNNGPAQCFLNMVNDFKWEEGVDQRVQLANMVKHNFEHKIPDDLKEIYMSCYEKTLENLDNPKIELSAAGAMAARFIVFDLFDD